MTLKPVYAPVLCLTLSACTPSDARRALDIMTMIGQGAQYVGSLLGVAEGGAEDFYEAHPNPDEEWAVRALVRAVREALAQLNDDLAMGRDVEASRLRVLEAYERLREGLYKRGIPDAVTPAGGASTEAPEPQPFTLPPVQHVAEYL